MELRRYYLENITSDEYYYKFYDLVEKVNYTWNAFSGYNETNCFKFEVYDEEEAINKFREICMPENQDFDNESTCWFYVIAYYLHKKGYRIKEFPSLLMRPPATPYDFSYKIIREWIKDDGEDDNGRVKFDTRRRYVKKLSFEKHSHLEINDENIERRFSEISTHGARFDEMSSEEKIAELANLIEHYLKTESGFLNLDYNDISFGFINNDSIMRYRKNVQCFRHSSEISLAERKEFSEKQMNFLIDYGIVIIKLIESKKKEVMRKERDSKNAEETLKS